MMIIKVYFCIIFSYASFCLAYFYFCLLFFAQVTKDFIKYFHA